MKKYLLIIFSLLNFFIFTTTSASAYTNFNSYYLVKDIGDYKIIVEDKWGDQYVVEYGIGCLSMWRYEGKNIIIDIGGSFLDGIGDKIYLVESDDSCSVWDADEIENTNSNNYIYIPAPSTPVCADLINGFFGVDGKCYCNDGYSWDVSINSCQKTKPTCGNNEYIGADNLCHCNSGYIFNSATNQCLTYSANCKNIYGTYSKSVSNNTACGCVSGYGLNSLVTKCVSADNLCKESYGIYAESDETTTSNGGYNCLCKIGYTWNADNTSCVKSPLSTTTLTPDNNILLEDSFKSPFTDVTPTNKNIDAIKFLKEKGIISGYSDGTFKPENPVSRAELLKIIVEGKGVDLSNIIDNNCFADVTNNDWFEPYVCYAKSVNWVSGYSDGTFKPNQNVKKVEAIKILLNSQYISIPNKVDLKPYNDVNLTDWFTPYISTAKQLGILEESGYLFFPNMDMKRAGICENLFRLLTLDTL